MVFQPTAIFAYKVDDFSSPENDRGLAFDDASLSIDWQIPIADLQLSEKDTQQLSLAEFEFNFEYGVNYYE